MEVSAGMGLQQELSAQQYSASTKMLKTALDSQEQTATQLLNSVAPASQTGGEAATPDPTSPVGQHIDVKA